MWFIQWYSQRMTGLGSNPSQARIENCKPSRYQRAEVRSPLRSVLLQALENCDASENWAVLWRSVKHRHTLLISWKKRSTKLNICPVMLSSFACLSRCSTQCISGTGETEVPRRNSSSHTALRWILSILSHRKGEKGHKRRWIPQSMVPEDPSWSLSICEN